MEYIENLIALGLSAYHAGRYSMVVSGVEYALAALAYISKGK